MGQVQFTIHLHLTYGALVSYIQHVLVAYDSVFGIIIHSSQYEFKISIWLPWLNMVARPN